MFNKEIEIITKKPFKLFRINNFLSNELYENLKNTFPNLDDIEHNHLDLFKNKKYGFDTSSEIYKKCLDNNRYFSSFEKLVFSKEFLFFFL